MVNFFQNAVILPAPFLSIIFFGADSNEGFLCGDCPVKFDRIYMSSLLVDDYVHDYIHFLCNLTTYVAELHLI